MLNLPESGILPYSEKKGHRSDLNVFTDWLEGSLLFGTDDTLSIAEIKDVLTDEHVYEDQDKASELLSDVWRNIGLSQFRSRQFLSYSRQEFQAHTKNEVAAVSGLFILPPAFVCELLSQVGPKVRQ